MSHAVKQTVRAVPITPMELIHTLRLWVETIRGKFTIADTLLGVIQLMPNMNSFLASYTLSQ